MSKETNNVITVDCPTCNSPVEWIEANKLRPFCSDRCKLIDLGAWASEDYKVAGKPASEWDLPDMPIDSENNTLQ